jgi:hypothetical protein
MGTYFGAAGARRNDQREGLYGFVAVYVLSVSAIHGLANHCNADRARAVSGEQTCRDSTCPKQVVHAHVALAKPENNSSSFLAFGSVRSRSNLVSPSS